MSCPAILLQRKRLILKGVSPDEVINKLVKKYSKENINNEDGLRIDFWESIPSGEDHWVHLEDPILNR